MDISNNNLTDLPCRCGLLLNRQPVVLVKGELIGTAVVAYKCAAEREWDNCGFVLGVVSGGKALDEKWYHKRRMYRMARSFSQVGLRSGKN